jgi:membrane-associated phospholipid phosphatase
MTLAIAAFLWNRVRRRWQPLWAAYVIIMAFTLVYTAEHFVIDILLGWALAAVVLGAIAWFKSRRDGPSSEKAEVQPDLAALS